MLCLLGFNAMACLGQSSSSCTISTPNSGFEQPSIRGDATFLDQTIVPGWHTSASDNQIEFWTNGAYEGTQYIELNANMPSTLYQDFNTPNPTVFTVHFAHKGRLGTDVCRLYAGPPVGGTTQTVVEASDSNAQWGVYDVTYSVPAGQPITRFNFEAKSTANDNPTIGNFLDDIRIVAENGVTGPNPVTVCGISGKATVTAGGTGTWIASSSNPGSTSVVKAANDIKNTTVISGFPALGTYVYEWKTGYCTSTLTVNVVAPPSAPGISSNSPVVVGATLALSATVSGNITRYRWTGPNQWNSTASNPTIPNVTLANGGYYTLVTSSADGCDSPPVKVLAIVSNGRYNISVCEGEDIDLFTTISAGQWTGPLGYSTSVTLPVINNAAVGRSGTYVMTSTPAGQIEYNDVVVSALPKVSTLTSNSPRCKGDVITVTANDEPGATYQWVGPDGYTQSTQSHIFTRTNATLSMRGAYSVTIISAQGCVSAQSSTLVDVSDGLTAPEVAARLPICEGQRMYLNYKGIDDPVYSYLWTGPNGFSSSQKSPFIDNISLAASGTYEFKITAPGLSCPFPTAYLSVDVDQNPSADAGGDITVSQLSSKEIMASATGNNLIYRWEPATYLDDPALLKPTVVHPKKTTTYRLTALSMHGNLIGCFSFSDMTVYVPVVIPNVFTPNGDGIEDKWDVQGIAGYTNCEVRVFNRYGDLIFYSTGYESPWDGTFEGKGVPVGTYYYVIDLKDGSGLRGGYVAVIR